MWVMMDHPEALHCYSGCKVRGMEYEFKVPDPTGALRISGT